MGPRTLGVEEELLLVDPESGHPQSAGDRVVARCADVGRVESELKLEQVEYGTAVTRDLSTLRADLRALRRTAAAAAGAEGVALAAMATSPFSDRPHTTHKDRYERMDDEFGLLAVEQLTCGCHVHVGVGSRAEGVAVIDRIAPWLGVLVALTTNSPFWQGQDTGYASYRSQVWGRWPAAGPTGAFRSVEAYDDLVRALVDSRGVLDTAMIYFDARLSARYPTVEIRVADVCLEADDAVLVAGLCRALVETAARQHRAGVPLPSVRPELLRAARWRAARSGIQGELIDVVARCAVPARGMVERLLRHVDDALRDAGDADAVRAGVEELLARGTGAQRQRTAYAREGSLRDVVADVVRRTVPE